MGAYVDLKPVPFSIDGAFPDAQLVSSIGANAPSCQQRCRPLNTALIMGPLLFREHTVLDFQISFSKFGLSGYRKVQLSLSNEL